MVLRVSFVDPAHASEKDEDSAKQCSFCLRMIGKVDHLVKAPAVSICSLCVGRCLKALDPKTRKKEEPPMGAYRTADRTCDFCRQANESELIVGEHARICATCVRLALEVLLETLDR